ncbi:MAG: Periplasmic pH-dependent serine endoprotease DegQ precursor [Actinomycetota bacterium]
MRVMKRIWLVFSQSVTVLLAAWFVVATLQPGWLKGQGGAKTLALTQARMEGNQDAMPGGSFRQAAQKAAPAVVSINVQQKARSKARRADPWFRFFEEPEDESTGGGMGSGVIVSAEGASPIASPGSLGRRVVVSAGPAGSPRVIRDAARLHDSRSACSAARSGAITSKAATTAWLGAGFVIPAWRSP